ncbi:MAG: NAD(P)-dependent oxidoreductase [Albidovulum sp.]|nr:NAD(P)-dependent oxidoreductase [Albidovulum sp.]
MDFLTDEFLVDPKRFNGPVLVTGAGGCIGAWAMAILKRSGAECIGFDLSADRQRPSLVLGAADTEALTWETGDITDSDSLNSVVRKHSVASIIHLAGLQVPFCKADPALGARVNVEGTINVLEAARRFRIKRTVLASSVAALALPPGGQWSETLYGAYKQANEHTAFVYWSDWKVPSVCIRPCIVYGLARDQGVSSKNTVAIQAAARDEEYIVPYSGPLSWLYAGEAAAAFIAAASQDGQGAFVFNLNGPCETVEFGLDVVRSLAPEARISCAGSQLPFPADLDDGPLRAHVPDYPNIPVAEGIKATYRAYQILKSEGRLPPLPN